MQQALEAERAKGLVRMHQRDAFPDQNQPQQTEAPVNCRQRGLAVEGQPRCIVHLQPVGNVAHAAAGAVGVRQHHDLHKVRENEVSASCTFGD